MTGCLRGVCVLLLAGCALADKPPEAHSTIWRDIRALAARGTAQGNPELVAYLKSLTAEEMLLAARQACEEAANRPIAPNEVPREGAAEVYVGLCLHYYFDRIAVDPGAQILLAVVRDIEDSALLRSGILARMGDSPETESEQTLQRYMEMHRPELDAILTKILGDRNDDPIVRAEVIGTLTWLLTEQTRKIILADANRHAIWEQTHEVVPVGRLMRSGELTLTEESLKALEPLEARALTYVKLLGAILADEKNEPEELRKRARRALERRYKRLPFPDLDKEIDKALQQPSE